MEIDKMKMQTRDGVSDNISWIAEKFPNCVTEKIDAATGEVKLAVDFDMLRQELSSEIVEGKDERYQFVWPDKKKAILLANAPINATLRPCPEESVDFDNTHNLYIEGDNLDVLKCLKETYLGKVKMIFIDPPYNTGNDFVYNDDFAESAEEYLANSGQYDEQGNRLVSNTESNGRFHTDWLNMMYPRMRIAKDLLSKDGSIFITLDDHEYGRFRVMCDEIFGENNFVATIIWENFYGRSNAAAISPAHNYVLVYSKAGENWRFIRNLLERDEKSISNYKNPDNDPKGPWRLGPIFASGERHAGLMYTIKTPNGDFVSPPKGSHWRMLEKDFWKRVEEGTIVFGMDGKGSPATKLYLSDVQSGLVPRSIWMHNEAGHTQDGKREVMALFPECSVFDTPKPTKLIKQITKIACSSSDIILDFFSGSATTADSIMQLNAEDAGCRKYIMVQIPEKFLEASEPFKYGYKNLCDVGKERIRRAAKKIKEETGANIDYGFRVLKLDTSNMEDVYYSPAEVNQDQLKLFADNVKPDRTGEDLLFQSMLDLGATLDSKIEKTEVNGKTVFNVADGYLVACFDTEVSDDVVKAIAQMQPQYAVLRDSSLADDSTVTNFEQIFKTYSPTTTCKIL